MKGVNMLNIQKNKAQRAKKVLLYGVEGVGKTTLASKFPEPLFIDLDQGSDFMEVDRVSDIRSFEELMQALREIGKTSYQTVVIDTADKTEELGVLHLLQKHRKNGLEDFGYGSGFTYLKELMSVFLTACSQLIAEGKHVVILAHSKLETIKDPLFEEEYQRHTLKFESKGGKQISPLFKEWADLMLFCNYETFLSTQKTGKATAHGKRRLMYAERTQAFDAKNRFGLPEKMELDFKHIAHLFSQTQKEEPKQDKKRELITSIRQQCINYQVTSQAILELIGSKGLKYTKDYKTLEEASEKDLENIYKNFEFLVNKLKEKPADAEESYELPFEI